MNKQILKLFLKGITVEYYLNNDWHKVGKSTPISVLGCAVGWRSHGEH